jgi:pimeloyl-ACP methyl ester carboxylesterase
VSSNEEIRAMEAVADRTPLMLIHGAWLSGRSWKNYADCFAKRGFVVSAPEWPRKHSDVDERRQDAEESAGLGAKQIVDHYEWLIVELERPPALIGHSWTATDREALKEASR